MSTLYSQIMSDSEFRFLESTAKILRPDYRNCLEKSQEKFDYIHAATHLLAQNYWLIFNIYTQLRITRNLYYC
jgi:hypothetical protein